MSERKAREFWIAKSEFGDKYIFEEYCKDCIHVREVLPDQDYEIELKWQQSGIDACKGFLARTGYEGRRCAEMLDNHFGIEIKSLLPSEVNELERLRAENTKLREAAAGLRDALESLLDRRCESHARKAQEAIARYDDAAMKV